MSPILWNGTSGALTFPKPLIVSVVTVPTHGKQQRRFPLAHEPAAATGQYQWQLSCYERSTHDRWTANGRQLPLPESL